MGKFKFINKRSLKYGLNSIILIVAVIAIAVVVNLLVGMKDYKLDLTAQKLYSLSDESKKIIKGINKEVTIYGLFDDATIPNDDGYKEIMNLLSDYKKLGVKVVYIDPDKNTDTIKEFDKEGTKGIAKGDFVVKSGNKVRKLSANDLYGQTSDYGRLYKAEPLLTGAIKFVASDITPVAYFVEGHNEFSLANDLNQVKSAFENNNFEIKSLSILAQKKIPEDCKLLIFASPQKDLSEDEKIKVNEYLKNNGKVIFLFDPLEIADKFTNFEDILYAYNIGINYDMVKENEANRHLTDNEYAIISMLEKNDINKKFNNTEYPVFMPNSRSISILKNPKTSLTTTSLLKTSEKSVSTSIIEQGKETKGPLDLAVAAEMNGGGKVLVFGNGSFIMDSSLSGKYGEYYMTTANYMLSTIINWMQDKSDISTITPKLVTGKALMVTESQKNIITILLAAVLPLLIMGCGFVVWSRRRHL